jgi:hypothetical protein
LWRSISDLAHARDLAGLCGRRAGFRLPDLVAWPSPVAWPNLIAWPSLIAWLKWHGHETER